jgi:hypothetical protein
MSSLIITSEVVCLLWWFIASCYLFTTPSNELSIATTQTCLPLLPTAIDNIGPP